MSTLDRLLPILKQHCSHEASGASQLHRDLGMDDLDLIDLAVDIEDAFEIDIPDDALLAVSTIDDLVALVDLVVGQQKVPQS